MDISLKETKDAFQLYANQHFKKVNALTKDDMVACSKKLGYKIPPYLAVEAYLYACGGYKINGSGPFDPEQLHKWLLQREVRLGHGKHSKTQSMDQHRPIIMGNSGYIQTLTSPENKDIESLSS